ncbi:Panacea domain-containing protein [Chryseobacterium gotjawalense]|uniref:Panacea domain-containing protein n=1 Tax=Chryseobacterium gotjawalense TaxID=3042315 RepID=A0ABY8RDQ8_9FLAO|nr:MULTISPECIES: Panacea domain-containing protein [unclassified Chryseobacterium]MDQ0478143.1 putative phage-associated protein [Chryseobacterium sp. MDT2-18]WHF51308.1 Panacea domain-containing protein [Chryseobacterium sp. wdc7]
MSAHTEHIKIANALIYIAEKLGGVYLTKALKLLYLLDETSVKETGVPFSWMEYKAWKMGPVPKELYTDLREVLPHQKEEIYLSEFIAVNKVPNPVSSETRDAYVIVPKKQFSEDEFSEYDIELMDRVLKEYGHLSGADIIEMLHTQGSLWDTVVKDKELQLQFALMQNRSDFTIPFTDLIKDDVYKQMAYKSAFESSLSHNEFSL